jgi:hypothetical protein
VFQPNDEAIPAPQFDILAVDQPPGLLDCFGVIRARQPHEPYKVSVATDEIRPIFSHRSPVSGWIAGPSNAFREQVAMVTH